jgi:hypothetical protein
MHGPGGDGGECTQADAATATDAAPVGNPTTARPAATTGVKPPAATRIKPAITVRGGSDDGSSVHAPRWHSFLPGMFR